MNWLDWVLLVIIILSAWQGLRKGFLAGIARLLGLVLGLAAAFAGYGALADYLDRQWGWGNAIAAFFAEHLPQGVLQVLYDRLPLAGDYPAVILPEQVIIEEMLAAAHGVADFILNIIAFTMLFLVVFLLVVLVMRIFAGAVEHSFLSPLDRLGGLLLGAARGILVVIIVAVLLEPVLASGALAGGEVSGVLGRAATGSLFVSYAWLLLDAVNIHFPGWPAWSAAVTCVVIQADAAAGTSFSRMREPSAQKRGKNQWTKTTD